MTDRGMKLWRVVVHQEPALDPPQTYIVEGTTSNDARLLAFVMDGGWGPVPNANAPMDGSVIELAFMYTDEPEMVTREEAPSPIPEGDFKGGQNNPPIPPRPPAPSGQGT